MDPPGILENPVDDPSMPTILKIVHKSWKTRSDGYREINAILDTNDQIAATAYGDRLVSFLQDKNQAALDLAYSLVLNYIRSFPNIVANHLQNLLPLVLEAGLVSSRPSTRKTACAIVEACVDIDKHDYVILAIVASLSSKNQKVVAKNLELLAGLVRSKGIVSLNPKHIRGLLAPLFSHQDKEVRLQSFKLSEELYRWMRSDIWPFLSSCKPIQQAELKSLFDRIDKHDPVHLVKPLQSSGDKSPITESPSANNPEILLRGENPFTGENLWNTRDLVSLESHLDESCYSRINSVSWKERKQKLDSLHLLVTNKRLLPSTLIQDFIKVLAKRLATDTNIPVLLSLLNLVAGIIDAMRLDFLKYSSLLVLELWEKLKEKKLLVPLEHSLLGLFLYSLPPHLNPGQHVFNNTLPGLRSLLLPVFDLWSKNPPVLHRKESLNVLVKFFFSLPDAVYVWNILSKQDLAIILKNLLVLSNEAASDVRNVGFRGFAIVSCHFDRIADKWLSDATSFLASFTDSLDTSKQRKISEIKSSLSKKVSHHTTSETTSRLSTTAHPIDLSRKPAMSPQPNQNLKNNLKKIQKQNQNLADSNLEENTSVSFSFSLESSLLSFKSAINSHLGSDVWNALNHNDWKRTCDALNSINLYFKSIRHNLPSDLHPEAVLRSLSPHLNLSNFLVVKAVLKCLSELMSIVPDKHPAVSRAYLKLLLDAGLLRKLSHNKLYPDILALLFSLVESAGTYYLFLSLFSLYKQSVPATSSTVNFKCLHVSIDMLLALMMKFGPRNIIRSLCQSSFDMGDSLAGGYCQFITYTKNLLTLQNLGLKKQVFRLWSLSKLAVDDLNIPNTILDEKALLDGPDLASFLAIHEKSLPLQEDPSVVWIRQNTTCSPIPSQNVENPVKINIQDPVQLKEDKDADLAHLSSCLELSHLPSSQDSLADPTASSRFIRSLSTLSDPIPAVYARLVLLHDNQPLSHTLSTLLLDEMKNISNVLRDTAHTHNQTTHNQKHNKELEGCLDPLLNKYCDLALSTYSLSENNWLLTYTLATDILLILALELRTSRPHPLADKTITCLDTILSHCAAMGRDLNQDCFAKIYPPLVYFSSESVRSKHLIVSTLPSVFPVSTMFLALWNMRRAGPTPDSLDNILVPVLSGYLEHGYDPLLLSYHIPEHDLADPLWIAINSNQSREHLHAYAVQDTDNLNENLNDNVKTTSEISEHIQMPCHHKNPSDIRHLPSQKDSFSVICEAIRHYSKHYSRHIHQDSKHIHQDSRHIHQDSHQVTNPGPNPLAISLAALESKISVCLNTPGILNVMSDCLRTFLPDILSTLLSFLLEGVCVTDESVHVPVSFDETPLRSSISILLCLASLESSLSKDVATTVLASLDKPILVSLFRTLVHAVARATIRSPLFVDHAKSLNRILVKFLVLSDSSAVYDALLHLVSEHSSAYLNGLAATIDRGVPLYQELLLKCLWKVLRSLRCNVNNGSTYIPGLLSALESFLVENPPCVWKSHLLENKLELGPDADLPLRTVKTVCSELVAIYSDRESHPEESCRIRAATAVLLAMSPHNSTVASYIVFVANRRIELISKTNNK